MTPKSNSIYSAIYLSGDLGTRVSVTTGQRDVEAAKAAVERWCDRAREERLADGEVLVCRAGDRDANRPLRVVARWIDGRWQAQRPVAPDPDRVGATRATCVEF